MHVCGCVCLQNVLAPVDFSHPDTLALMYIFVFVLLTLFISILFFEQTTTLGLDLTWDIISHMLHECLLMKPFLGKCMMNWWGIVRAFSQKFWSRYRHRLCALQNKFDISWSFFFGVCLVHSNLIIWWYNVHTSILSNSSSSRNLQLSIRIYHDTIQWWNDIFSQNEWLLSDREIVKNFLDCQFFWNFFIVGEIETMIRDFSLQIYSLGLDMCSILNLNTNFILHTSQLIYIYKTITIFYAVALLILGFGKRNTSVATLTLVDVDVEQTWSWFFPLCSCRCQKTYHNTSVSHACRCQWNRKRNRLQNNLSISKTQFHFRFKSVWNFWFIVFIQLCLKTLLELTRLFPSLFSGYVFMTENEK